MAISERTFVFTGYVAYCMSPRSFSFHCLSTTFFSTVTYFCLHFPYTILSQPTFFFCQTSLWLVGWSPLCWISCLLVVKKSHTKRPRCDRSPTARIPVDCGRRDGYIYKMYLLTRKQHYLCPISSSTTTLCPKNVTNLTHYNSDRHKSTMIIFGTNVTEKVGNQKVLQFPTSPN